MSNWNLYLSPAPFISTAVTFRENGTTALNVTAYAEAVEKANAAIEASESIDGGVDAIDARAKARQVAIAERDELAQVAKSSHKFVPSPTFKYHRWTVDSDTLAAWLAESDPEARSAILAGTGAVPKPTPSPVHHSIAGAARYQRALIERARNAGTLPSVQFLSELSDGILIVPTSGSEKTPAKNAPRLKGAAATNAAALAMFADADSAFVDALQVEANAENAENAENAVETPTVQDAPASRKRGKN